jgi:hypothetical protein
MSMRGSILARSKAKEASISAVITRADGSIEDLGVISYWHKNPFKRWAWSLRKLWKRIRKHGR